MTRLRYATELVPTLIGPRALPVRGTPPVVRRPRSSRVRDRWDRMRPPVALQRTWFLDVWEGGTNPGVNTWRDALERAYPQGGDITIWRDDYPGAPTVTARFKPYHLRRTA